MTIYIRNVNLRDILYKGQIIEEVMTELLTVLMYSSELTLFLA